MAAKPIQPKKIALYLLIAFVVVSVWKDPSASATYAGDFLGQIGHFLRDLYSKLAEFIAGIGKK